MPEFNSRMAWNALLRSWVKMAEERPYGTALFTVIASAIFTQDLSKAFHAMRELNSGIVYINHGTTGAEIQLPFGGTKATGNGAREAGQAALDTFSEWKSIYVDYSGRLQRAQLDTEELTRPE
jgi:acyl-CoA reductase-like NAD-dependent aldehyde dehydrogenase